MKQDESQGTLKPSYVPLSYDLRLKEMDDAVRRGPKESKSETRTILETSNKLYSIQYNPHFQNIYHE